MTRCMRPITRLTVTTSHCRRYLLGKCSMVGKSVSGQARTAGCGDGANSPKDDVRTCAPPTSNTKLRDVARVSKSRRVSKPRIVK